VRHFHRTTLRPDQVLASADEYFGGLGLARGGADARSRQFTGGLGAMRLTVRMEGGHYTLVEAFTDQIGESRLDKNVRNFFASLHRTADPRHRIEAGY
jgi:hypothetical protein